MVRYWGWSGCKFALIADLAVGSHLCSLLSVLFPEGHQRAWTCPMSMNRLRTLAPKRTAGAGRR